MQQKNAIAITCEAFKKNSDGSWVSIQVNDVNTPYGVIRIPPGMKLTKGMNIAGTDIAEVLDENCGK